MKLKIYLILTLAMLGKITIGQESHPELSDLMNLKNANFYQIQKSFNDYWTPFNVKNGKYIKDGLEVKAPGWKLFKRWEWYWEPRIDVTTGEFPTTSTAEQWEKYKASPDYSQLKSSTGSWTSVGPVASDGGYAGIGRINCISFHPSDTNTYWVGSPSGGLWKTTDNGSTWFPLTDNNDILGVSDIAIPSDYETSNTIYIATGDRDGGSAHTLGGGNNGDNNTIGILKSTNGGASWSSALSFNAGDGYLSGFLRIHPTNNSVLYAGIANVVFKSTDAGASWGSPIYNAKDYIIDMEFHPSNPDTLYIATKASDSVKIARTFNGGQNWTVQHNFGSSDRRIELAVSPANSSYVYAVVANNDGGLSGIYKSTDNGDTFVEVFDGDAYGADHSLLGYYSDGSGDNSGQGGYDLALSVSPTNADVLYLGGINTWKSEDGGVTWTINNMWTNYGSYNKVGAPEVHADKHVLKFQSPTTLFEGNDGGIYKTSNGGETWTDLTNGMTISQIYRLGVSPTLLNTVMTGLQDNGSKLYYSGDWYDVTGGDGMECLIDYTDHNIQYGTYINGQISRTTDLWNSSIDIYENIGDGSLEGHWVTPFIIDPVDHNTIYVGYQDVWRSTDKGDSFIKISTMNTNNDLRSMAIAPSDNQVIYVADQSNLWVTKNGGLYWTEVSGTLPSRITYLAVHAYDPNTVWATIGGYNGSHVYESTDRGTTWTDISAGLPNLPAFCIVQNKQSLTQNHLYVGTDRGVYFKDGTDDWVLFNSGLPNVMVTELEIYYDEEVPNNSILYAATYGRGLWQSDLKEIPVPDLDAGIKEIISPENKIYCGLSSIAPTIKIKNYGSSNITSFTASYNLDEESSISTNWTGSLANGEMTNIVFPEIIPPIGSYDFNAEITNINGGSDEVSLNNTNAVSFSVVDGNFEFPVSEGFNAATIPGCWSQEIVFDGGSIVPQISLVTSGTNPTQVPFEGSHMVKFNSDDCERGDQIRLISPAYSTEGKSEITVNFKWSESAIYSNKDSVTVQWSTDGTSWNNGETYIRYNNANPGWVTKSYVLPEGAENLTSLYIAFLFTSDYGINCYLDDLEITVVNSSNQSITSGTISDGPYDVTNLSGTGISVPFTSTGTFTSNVYTAYLSDASGSFASETAIGTLTSDSNTGTIQANIPANTPSGTAYKIRVKSSNPVLVGSESNTFEIRLINSSIDIGTISGSPFVVSKILGAIVNIPYTVTGNFSSNTFTAFLSDASGSFTEETAIGSINSNTGGTMVGLIPSSTSGGEAYKIRIKSNNPVVISNESGSFSIVLDSIKPTVTLSSAVGDPTNISPIDVLINFSEPITDFDLSKISVVNGTKDNFVISGNTQFSFKLTPLADGVVSAQVDADLVQDVVGNYNEASAVWSTTYIQALGIEDLENNGIKIYPNPTKENLTIKFEERQKSVRLKVFGLNGKLYFSKELMNIQQYQLEMSSVESGIYIVQFLIEGKMLSARIIKQ